MKNSKICIVASAGGHLSQLLLLNSVWKNSEVVCVSSGQMVRKKLESIGKTYIVGECNREHPFKTLQVTIRCLYIVIRERPRIVLSTGAAVGFLMSFWGRFLGAKIIWVDSVANTKKLSMSGRLIRPFAHLILSQWKEVAEKHPNVKYAGELI